MIHTKNIITLEDELTTFLSSFKLLEALRVICRLASYDRYGFCGVNVVHRLILHSSDNKTKFMSYDEGCKALEMDFKIQECKLNITSIHETLLKLENQQHENNEIIKYDIARTLYLYENLWKITKEAKVININESIKQITNLDLSTLLALNYSFTKQSKDVGYIIKYDRDKLHSLSKSNQEIYNEKNQDLFLNYCSINYEKVRALGYQDLNILKKYPLIDTQTIPNGLNSQVYMVPSFNNLIKKTTTNLYYSLADKYKVSGGNSFKSAFGFVFEAYVKTILKACLKSWKIEGDEIYEKKFNKAKIDIFIYKDDKLILVEIKQASIYSESKNNCIGENIKQDLRQTITKGVNQILKTEKLIQDNDADFTSKFKYVKYFQRLIVTYLPLKCANFSIKPLIKEYIGDYPIQQDFHIINIHELELLLSNQHSSGEFFFMLQKKERYSPDVEFEDYINDQYPNSTNKIEILEKIQDEFYKPFFKKE